MSTTLVASSLAAAAMAAGAAAPAQASTSYAAAQEASVVTAPNFNATGNWSLYQANGPVVRLNLTQDSNGKLYGTARWDNDMSTVNDGAVTDSNIAFSVHWGNGGRGRYVGSLTFDRRLSGSVYNPFNPSEQSTWLTSRTF
ncbi:hypothetical protein [Actinoplanes sp. NPDC026670]|uniref:hypothetical protein n=1 Tax=Actinoplanes sp. NPDC026670 TaxID=3154700 RepID=UPI00340301F9